MMSWYFDSYVMWNVHTLMYFLQCRKCYTKTTCIWSSHSKTGVWFNNMEVILCVSRFPSLVSCLSPLTMWCQKICRFITTAFRVSFWTSQTILYLLTCFLSASIIRAIIHHPVDGGGKYLWNLKLPSTLTWLHGAMCCHLLTWCCENLKSLNLLQVVYW